MNDRASYYAVEAIFRLFKKFYPLNATSGFRDGNHSLRNFQMVRNPKTTYSTVCSIFGQACHLMRYLFWDYQRDKQL